MIKNISSYEFFNKRKQKNLSYALIALIIIALLGLLILCLGDSNYSPSLVIKVLSGQDIKGASFAIRRIRLPRMLAAFLSGAAFAIGGNTFQTMLSNPLASPDVIGVNSGASFAAVFAILILGWSGWSVSILALIFGLLVAVLILVLSSHKGFNTSRLILVGIGFQAFMSAMISFVIERSSEYKVAEAVRWLNGSLNGIQMDKVLVLGISLAILGFASLMLNKHLQVLQLGEDLSITLGLRVKVLRLILLLIGVSLVAITTSITGPIASVSFLAPPISRRILANGQSDVLASGMMGSILVMLADLISQNFLGVKFPVGIITGLIGAPYLLFLIIEQNKKEGGR